MLFKTVHFNLFLLQDSLITSLLQVTAAGKVETRTRVWQIPDTGSFNVHFHGFLSCHLVPQNLESQTFFPRCP